MTKRRRKRRRPSIPEQMSARAVAEVLRLPVAVVNAWSASTLNRKGRARLAARGDEKRGSEWMISRRAFCEARRTATQSGLRQRRKLRRERALIALSRAYQRAHIVFLVDHFSAMGVRTTNDAVDLAVLTARRWKRAKVKVSRRSVMEWRARYRRQGLAGLVGHYVPGRQGRPRKVVNTR